MSRDDPEKQKKKLDQATADRLSRLRTILVDTSRLDRSIDAEIRRPIKRSAFRILQGWSVRALAAGILVVAVLTAFFVMSGGPVVASATEMARFYEDVVSGHVTTPEIESVENANRALAVQWAQPPQVRNMPADQFMVRCMRSMKNKKVACVLLKDSSEWVTITVANASDMGLPTSPILTRDNVTYHVQSSGNLNMVITERAGRWICVIGKLPADHMIDLASGIKF